MVGFDQGVVVRSGRGSRGFYRVFRVGIPGAEADQPIAKGETVMRKFKRNTVIIVWADALLIATACFFIFYVREVFPRNDYEHVLMLTAFVSVYLGLVVGMIHKMIGKKIAKGQKNWDNLINKLPSENKTIDESIFFITYIIMSIAFALSTPALLISLWERHLDRQ